MAKRDLFAELMQGVNEMAQQRQGKVTLRKVAVEKNLYQLSQHRK